MVPEKSAYIYKLLFQVKASIGHCEAASGIAAVMKAVLAVEKGVIPPTYGFTNPNPRSKSTPADVRVVLEPQVTEY